MHDLTSDISEEIIEETTEGTQITLSGLEPGVEYSIAARTISIQRGRNSKQYTIDDFTCKDTSNIEFPYSRGSLNV